jgi:SWIM zinc finger
MKPKHIKILQEKARDMHATPLNKTTVVVESASNPAANHIVTVEYDSDGTIHARCTCPWAINGGVACSHVIAALEALAERRGRRLSFWTNMSEAQRQKKRIFYLRGTKARVEENEGVWITSRAA